MYKYILEKFKMDDNKPVNIPMVIGCKLSEDDESLGVDKPMYRSIIGGLLYVIAARPNIMYSIGLVARFQYATKETHILSLKKIFRYLKGTI